MMRPYVMHPTIYTTRDAIEYNVQNLQTYGNSTACPNKNLTIFARKIYCYKWKFWNEFGLHCNNKWLKFCLTFVPLKAVI